jgi:hypothetical protein
MAALLEFVIAAHGRQERWNQHQTLTAPSGPRVYFSAARSGAGVRAATSANRGTRD